MLDIYNYTEAHVFLRDAWRHKKAKNEAFSLGSWARTLGFENSSPLSLALKGKRTLPKRYLPKLVASLDLSHDEAQYLETMIDYARAKSPDEKIFYIEKLRKLSPREVTTTIVEEYKFLSEPLAAAILEMSDLKAFKPDPYWIQSHLRFHRPLHDIAEIIHGLIELGLLEKTGDGRFQKRYKDLISPNDIVDVASRQFHAKTTSLAAHAVQNQTVEEREFQTFAFNVEKRNLAKAKTKIRNFVTEFLKEFEATSNQGDATVILALQFFGVSK